MGTLAEQKPCAACGAPVRKMRSGGRYFEAYCTSCKTLDSNKRLTERRAARKVDVGRTTTEEQAAKMRASNAARRDPTLPTATRNNQPWTTVELDTIQRADLTISQMATMLGRTYSAVVQMRQRADR